MDLELLSVILKLTPDLIKGLVAFGQATPTKRQARAASTEIFKQIFQSMTPAEQSLILELLKSGEVIKFPGQFYIEDPCLRTHTFESIINRTWLEKFSMQEEQYANQLPIQIYRFVVQEGLNYRIESYTFRMSTDVRKAWRKLYKKIKSKI